MKTFGFVSVIFLACFILPLSAGSYHQNSNDVLRYHIKDMSRLVELSQDDPLMKFWKSKSMKPFREALDKKIEEGMREFQKKAKLSEKPNFMALVKGEFLASLSSVDYSAEKESFNSLSGYLVFDGGQSKNTLAESLFKMALDNMDEDAKKGHPRKDVNFMGSLFHTSTLEIKGSKKQTFPKGTQLRLGKIDQHYFVGVGQEVELEKILSKLIPSIKSSKKSTSKEDFSFTLNMFQINEIIGSGLEKAEADKIEKMKKGQGGMGPMMFLGAVNLAKTGDALGLRDIDRLSMKVVCGEKSSRTEMDFLFNHEPRGLWKLFVSDMAAQADSIPSWVPESVTQFQSTVIPLSGWYSTIIDFVTAEAPMMAPMLIGTINQSKQKMGVDYEKDLFDLFNDKFYQLKFKTDPKKPEAQRDIFMVGLKNARKFEENIMKILGTIPLMKLEPEDYMGGRVYQLPSESGKQSGIAFAKNFFIFGTNFSDVKEVIVMMGRQPKSSLASSQKVKSCLKYLPKKYNSITFLNLDQFLKGILTTVKGALAKNLSMSSKDKDLWSKLPSADQIRESFGHVFSYGTRSAKGMHSVTYSVTYSVAE